MYIYIFLSMILFVCSKTVGATISRLTGKQKKKKIIKYGYRKRVETQVYLFYHLFLFFKDKSGGELKCLTVFLFALQRIWHK